MSYRANKKKYKKNSDENNTIRRYRADSRPINGKNNGLGDRTT